MVLTPLPTARDLYQRLAQTKSSESHLAVGTVTESQETTDQDQPHLLHQAVGVPAR